MDVIVLAGGRSTRMGRDKAQVRIKGTRLIDALLSSLPPLSSPIVVSPFDLGIPTVSEEPPFGGPVAGIAAALPSVSSDLVGVLAVDAPRSGEALALLADALSGAPDADAAAAVDADGRLQPLCAVWRRSALAAAVDRTGTRDVAVKALYSGVDAITVETGGLERDYDTPAELAELER